MPTIHEAELLLRGLKQRYAAQLVWFRTMTRAKIELRPTGQGNSFTLLATWDGGQHAKLFDASVAQGIGRLYCPKKLAEIYVNEVLRAKGDTSADEE